MSATLIKQAPFAKRSKKMVGTRVSVSAQGAVLGAPKMSGTGLSYLKIEGNTVDGVSTGEGGIEVRLSSKNLIDTDKLVELVEKYDTSISGSQIVEVDGRRCMLFYNNRLQAKDFTACGPVFKEKTRYIYSFEARPYTVLDDSENYSGRLFIKFKPEKTEIASLNTYLNAYSAEFKRLYLVNKPNTTITDISISYGTAHKWLIDIDSIYLYEYENNDNPEYEPPLIEKAILPSAVTLSDGTELQIRLALGESLELMQGSQSVIYHSEAGDYDLSHTDFAKELKSLCGKHGTDYEIMVKSAISPLSTMATYYSSVYEDKCTLLVRYECGGSAIFDSKQYSVRKGSAFKIIPPYINGYTPKTAQQMGVIDGDTEILLEYERKSK